MSNLLTIFRREFSSYFHSAIGVIFLIVFIATCNGLFMMQFFQIGAADMRLFFNGMPILLNIFIPALAMRLWAEDKRSGTYELLMTLPMKPWQLVLGKYFAGLAFFAFALLLTGTVPAMLAWLGQPDPGPIVCGYLGALFMGALYLAVGIFISGLCRDQITAFVLTAVLTFGFFFVGSPFFAQVVDGWVPGVGTFLQTHLGLIGHLSQFGRGVVDGKDLFYFILMASVFLFLNALSLQGRYRPKAKLVFAGAVVVSMICVVLVHGLIQDWPLGRWDLTEGRAYTVSDASKKILRELKAPLEIKFYVSPVDAMPTALKTLEREAMDKLEELRLSSAGKLRVKVIHIEAGPEGDEALKSTLRSDGIVPFQVESIQRDEVGIKLIYSTLVMDYLDKPSEMLPRVMPNALSDLEYQLMSRIVKMTLPKKPVIALYTPARQSPSEMDVEEEDDFRTAMLLVRGNGYETARPSLTKDSLIPDDARMLLLFNSGKLSDRQRYEINRYLTTGGTVIVAAQPFEFTYRNEASGMQAVPKKLDLDINNLTGLFGVRVNADVLMDKSSRVISLTTGQRVGPYALELPVQFENQIVVREDLINRDTVWTRRIPSLGYLWGAALDLDETLFKKHNLRPTVLFRSTAQSWKVPNDGSTPLESNPSSVPAGESKGMFPLAVSLEGQFPDTFVGSIPAWPSETSSSPVAAEGGQPTLKPGRLVIIGCSKAFSEDLIQNPGNLSLFANLIDGSVLGEELVQIRSKSLLNREIRRVSSFEKVAMRFWTILFMPLLLALFIGLRAWLRRKEKSMYLAVSRRRES